ncbi:peptide/nickel transport system substrate-binding protein [Herbihabitans rhizosphaerae]|uniref:Peptide/nickel transport system substrate-binding protein n=1 Tax=Herbihabitans rhizosphaerae TaxID=1872711 RepID=A0A4Q7L3F7_9PSEU|nr:peptide/nickel transport system substrate-binding protein [Herbihabitans rhizosphaerae]
MVRVVATGKQGRKRSRRGPAIGVVAAALGMAMLPAVAVPDVAPVAKAEQPQGKVLRVAVTQDIKKLNPFQGTSLVDTQVGRLMYEFLVIPNATDSTPEGALAESWTPSQDGKTWTFKMRKGVQWSDGQPITAKDVEFTYNQIMTNPGAKDANEVAVASFESVKATDPETVEIRTKFVNVAVIGSVGEIPIVPEHVWRDKVAGIKDFKNEQTPVVGSGPYVLSGVESGRSVTLKANDKFWRGRPKVDTLQMVKYENTEAASQALIKGDADLVYNLTPAQYRTLEKTSGIKASAGRNRRFTEIIMHTGAKKADGSTWGTGNPVLADVEFRKALDHAVNRKTLIEKVFGGYAEEATQLIPPVYPDWTFKLSDDKKRNFDIGKANSILDAAGYRKGDGGARLDKQGKPITLRLLSRNDRAEQAQMAEYVKEWFGQLGVTVDHKSIASSQLNDDTTSGNFDLSFSGWSVGPDPDNMLGQQLCKLVGTELGDTNICNPEYDRLFAQQQAELNKDKRKETVQRMQQMLYDNVSAIMLSYDKLLEAYRSDRFTTFVTQPQNGGIINNQSGYWGYYGATPVGETPPAGAPKAAEQTNSDSDSSGLGTGGWAAIIIGAVVVLGGLGLLGARRKRVSADDRE